MYHNIKTHNNKQIIQGFSLIELLVAIAIIGIISIIAVQGLYDIVSIQAKQQTIEDSSDGFRVYVKLITKSVIEAQRVSIPNPGEIQIVGDLYCQTIKHDPVTGSVLHSKVSSPCAPPDAGFVTVTNEDFKITSLVFSPTGSSLEAVSLSMEGYYKNSLGNHPIKYSTTLTKRI